MKYIYIVIAFSFILFSCEKDKITEDKDPVEEEELVVSKKKGFGQSTSGLEWSGKVASTTPYWHYSWGSQLLDIMEPDNVEFVPMIWGKSDVEQKIDALSPLVASGKVKYLLGFNEPDGEDQANMTVDEALALWPKLQELNIPLGSPVLAGHPTSTTWLKEFMSRGASEVADFRVDFICVHHYGGPSSSSLITKLQDVYAEWELPIWITEFAVADWSAKDGTTADNKFTVDQTIDFMKDVLPKLDALDYVERYAWFSFKDTSPHGHISALYDEDEKLTRLGWVYAGYAKNEEIGEAKQAPIYDNVEGNLIPNGNFGDYHIYGDPDENASESVGWFGYQIAVESADAVMGWAGKMKNDWSGDAALNNNFSVVAAKTYEISFYAKWLGTAGSIKMTLKDEDAIIAWEDAGKPSGLKPGILASSPTIIADETGNSEWEQVSFEYTVPANVSKLRLTLWKPNGSSVCLIDEVVAKEKL